MAILVDLESPTISISTSGSAPLRTSARTRRTRAGPRAIRLRRRTRVAPSATLPARRRASKRAAIRASIRAPRRACKRAAIRASIRAPKRAPGTPADTRSADTRTAADGRRMFLARLPLVTCIMPTWGRRRFVPFALAYFLRQDYANRELIVVDDGDDPVGDLIPDDRRIRYVRLPQRASVGAKRNLACEAARGELIAHWDDDDWHAADRLTRQVRALLESGCEICGTSSLRYYDIEARHAWEYRYPDELRRWVAGPTLLYRRTFWSEHRFDDIDVGEDAYFVWKARFEQIAVMPDHSFYLATIHPDNISPKATGTPYWRPCPVELVELQLGRDFSSLGAFAGGGTPSPPRAAEGVHNVYACLVHESRPCITDLVRNLHHTDPDSTVLLYN